MEAPPYRSFVVRAWARHGAIRRASIEVVQAGVSVELQGEAAVRLLASLDEALAEAASEVAAETMRERPGAATNELRRSDRD